MYAWQKDRGNYRGGKLTGAAYLRLSRALEHRADGLLWQGAHVAEPGSRLAESLAAVRDEQRALLDERRKARA